jgi:branched-subunit amino acid aminotransferase/4-amino-4-deoxychorismate lyase
MLPSVTRELLLDEAAAEGVTVRYDDVAPHDLDGLEVWAVNALHGIRPVIAWPGSPFEPGPAPRAESWSARLNRLAAQFAYAG